MITIIPPEEEDFNELLGSILHPSGPITQVELLRGREDQLKQIDRAVAAPGTSLFIFGDRGVGKTSLAQAAAHVHNPSSSEPVLISCDPTTPASYSLRELVAALASAPLLRSGRSHELRASLEVLGVKLEGQSKPGKISAAEIPEPKSVNEAASLLTAAIAVWRITNSTGDPVIVVDEFDRLGRKEDREFFGDLIKQVGDRRIPLQLFFCGVGGSADELMAAHPSSYRYVESVEVGRLGFEARMQILEHAATILRVEIERKHIVRIAAISDGFPYYVHLIGSRVIMEYADDPNPQRQIREDHFNRGIEAAVASCHSHLRAMYERAVQKYRNDYQRVLWAAAGDKHLHRRSTDVFEDYLRLATKLGETPLERSIFNRRMNALKTPAHGPVLQGSRTGWYSFCEPMLRGYCRLVAEQQHGLDLGEEY